MRKLQMKITTVIKTLVLSLINTTTDDGNNYGINIVLICRVLSLLCQRYAMDAAYYMAKELLMTERTYKKDLQVVAVVGTERFNFFPSLALLLRFYARQQELL